MSGSSPPGDMPSRIAAWLTEHDLPVPTTRPALVRCIVDSLAQAFADAVNEAEALSGQPIRVIHIVGGGALNRLLCQATADRSRADRCWPDPSRRLRSVMS